MGLDPTRTTNTYYPTSPGGTPQQPTQGYQLPTGQGGLPDPTKQPMAFTSNPGSGAPPAPDPGKGSAYPTPGFGSSTPPATSGGGGDYPLAGPGYNEDWYKTYGNDLMGTPSASEDLYSRGVAGSNPFYDYAQQQTIKAINDQSAARGNFNSSFTLKNIGNAVADLRGQQAHELGQLAGQADTGKFGRYDRGESYSRDAQRATEDRMKGSINAYTDLARGQSGLVNDFYGEAGRETTASDMARIEAMLKKSGMSQAEMDKWMNNLFSGMKMGAAAA